MKSDNPPFMPKPPTPTQPNEAWAVDFAMLDVAHPLPFVMTVIDVFTRRPLNATLTGPTAAIPLALYRLVRGSVRPGSIWIDNGWEFRAGHALRTWADRHCISIIYVPMQMPQMKALTEPALRDLGAFLRDKRFATLMELGHDIER